MKKRFVSIVIILTVIFAVVCTPTFASSKGYSKYIKVKKSTYQNIKKENKKLIKENIKLNNTINKYWKENTNLKEELAKLKSTSNSDLTNSNEYAIIMAEHEQIILSEREISCVDYMALVDSYVEGRWYCYYICADGDCYTVTIKNGHVDMFVQLN